MRKLFLVFSILLLLGFATADLQEVQYSVDSDEESMDMNTSIYMSCSSTCTGLKWSIPKNAEVLFVRNSIGNMDYSIEDNKVSIPGSRARGRDNETIKIVMRVNESAEEIYDGLYQRNISVPSFTGVKTTGFVRNEELISGRIGVGFDYGFSEGEMRFSGKGPTNLRFKFGEGQQTRYFEFFGSKPENTDSAYKVPIGVLRFQQKFSRFPVAVMTDSDYDRLVNNWSAGEYVGGGIKIREPESMETSFAPVLAHEVVHGLNDRKLNWDQTSSSYFDEGTSKYVEYLLRKKMYNEEEIDKPPRELFGEEVKYDPDPTDREYYKLSSKGNKEALWNYYQEDQDFMKGWSAFNAPDSETRSFGYAYSELIIANYVARKDGSVNNLYRDIEVNREVESPDVKWQIFSKHLDMTPCKYEDKQRFEKCLDEINSYDYPVYSASPQQGQYKSLQIDRLEVPNRTEPSGPVTSFEDANLSSAGNELKSFLTGFIDYLGSLLSGLF